MEKSMEKREKYGEEGEALKKRYIVIPLSF